MLKKLSKDLALTTQLCAQVMNGWTLVPSDKFFKFFKLPLLDLSQHRSDQSQDIVPIICHGLQAA